MCMYTTNYILYIHMYIYIYMYIHTIAMLLLYYCSMLCHVAANYHCYDYYYYYYYG